MGRPSSYSEETAEAICDAIADGKSLGEVCKLDGMPSAKTVYTWLADESKAGFLHNYARAREAQADKFAAEILQISDDGINDTQKDDEGRVIVDHDVIARSRLRVDSRKWLASKLAPKKYGDKVQQEHSGSVNLNGLTDDDLDRKIAAALAASEG